MFRRIPPLSKDEEYRLLALRTDKAKRKIIQANLGMVFRLAQPIARKHSIELDDLVQEGIIGMLKAMDKFRPERNFKFITYAVPWIRSYLNRYLKYVKSGGKTGEDQDYVKYRKEVSLDAPLPGTENDEQTYLDLLESGIDLGRLAEEQEFRSKAVEIAKKVLNDREWYIISHHQLSFLTEGHSTLSDMSGKLQLSKERVRQIEVKAMRKFLKAIKDYLGI